MIHLVVLFFLAEPPHIKAAAIAYQQGRAALMKKQPAAAVQFLNSAIQIEPTFIDAYEVLIKAEFASGDRLAAAATITRLLEIEPHLQQYRLQLAEILLTEQQYNRSLAQFSLLLQTDPYNADALLGFAAAAESLGLKDRAAAALATGRAHCPSDSRFRTQ